MSGSPEWKHIHSSVVCDRRPGVRVRYDLSRALALASVFKLHALGLPQGEAVFLVERAWPEICRAALVAAADCGIIPAPQGAPLSSASEN